MGGPRSNPGHPRLVDVSDAVVLVGLERRFGSVRACAGMSWSAPRGAVTAVLGPNGAGKTTAVDCAVGLQRPDAGTVRVLGTDPWLSAAEHRARVGVMLQSGGLPNGASAARLLPHLARLYAAPADLGPLMDRLGIGSFATTPVRRLSGGQKQRVGLAAALVGRPDVVFLDEPTAGLDPHGRLEVWRLLEEVRAEGTTLIVTTHSFEEAERLADHLVVVHHGKTLADGAVSEIAGTRPLRDVYFALTDAEGAA